MMPVIHFLHEDRGSPRFCFSFKSSPDRTVSVVHCFGDGVPCPMTLTDDEKYTLVIAMRGFDAACMSFIGSRNVDPESERFICIQDDAASHRVWVDLPRKASLKLTFTMEPMGGCPVRPHALRLREIAREIMHKYTKRI